MSVEWLAELGWKSVLLTALTFALLALARNRSAAEKSLIGDAGLLSLLLLPATIAWLPGLELAAPQSIGAFADRLALSSEPAQFSAGAGTVAVDTVGRFDWNAFAVGVYVLPLAALIAGLLYSLYRLHRVYARARVVEDAGWLTALAAAQNRIGIKRGTALLVSDDVNSPISWGVVRPVIVIDAGVRSAASRAEAIIAHELAHVHRLDWLKLIIARLVLAFFWFNPLAWVLARGCHQLREEAADDAVLRARVGQADYADVLVTAVRHSTAPSLLAANGVAPSRSSLAQRVTHVLDASRPRRAAPLGWTAAAFALAAAVNGAVAASEPVLRSSWGMDAKAGERAARELQALPGAHAQTLAAAIRQRNWDARRVDGPTTFDEPRALRPLITALRDDHPAVRRIAVWGLSEMRPTPGPIAIPAVSRLLEDPSPEVRAEAAGAIGEFDNVRNSRSLEKLVLLDPVPQVRLRAAHALGDIQDPDSRATLERALRDRDPRVRAKAKWALKQVSEAEEILNR